MPIQDALDRLRNWKQPREGFQSGDKSAFQLSCHLSPVPASPENIAQVNAGPDVEAFWRLSSEAELFKDETYGQWGLRILSPLDSLKLSARERLSRPNDVHGHDAVIGEFLGDSDLLVIDGSAASGGHYPVLVALPLDRRPDWPVVSRTFAEFLDKYMAAEGEKFWER